MASTCVFAFEHISTKYLLRQTLKFYSSLPNCTLGEFMFFFSLFSPLPLPKDRCNRWRLYEFSKSAKIMKAVIKP